MMMGVSFLLMVIVVAFFALVPSIPQDVDYHNFSDQNLVFGIPNFWNVVSNIPFVIVGALGLHSLKKNQSHPVHEQNAWRVLFVGVLLAGFGSAYYHWSPSNDTLLWDRLPMSIGFMGLFAVVIGERLGEAAYRRSFLPLLLLGVFSVFYWYFTEKMGSGDLRLYAIVQFLPLILIPGKIKFLPPKYSHGHYIYGTIGFYLLAKFLEHFDAKTHELLHLISGHSLKHIVAAIGCYYLVRMYQIREFRNN
jgi:hypothetical protein